MKMSPELLKASSNMAPGVITADGFLGNDTRPLADIIEEDEERFQALGIDFEGISARMHQLLQAGRRGLGEPITVEENWLVRVDEARGFLPCPFEDGIFRKITATVTNRVRKGSICYSDLSLHLLEKHHFLEGRGAVFRLEPEELKETLDL